MRLVRLLLLFAVIGSSLSVEAQTVEEQISEKYQSYWYYNPFEMAYLKTDKQLYFSGDRLHFSCILFNHFLQPSDRLSKIVHLALVGETGDSYTSFAFQNEGGLISSTIDLPEDIPTGNYQLVAYTRYMKNFDFEYYSHRQPIYIQHPNDRTKRVVSSINSNNQVEDASIGEGKPFTFSLTENEDKLIVNIFTNGQKERGTYYLVSEGFNSVQFIAKVKVRGQNSGIALPKSWLKGQFQKLVLVDETLGVRAYHAFFLQGAENGSKLGVENEINVGSEQTLNIDIPENLVTTMAVSKPFVEQDSISLFRRVYRHFYDIPLAVGIGNYSYEQLISDEVLSKFSHYTGKKWRNILAGLGNKEQLEFGPEQEITLYGKVSGSEPVPPKATLDLHLFKNQIDIFTEVEKDGNFQIALFDWTKTDIAYTSLLDENGEDLSADYSIEIVSEEVKYDNDVTYMKRKESDSLIDMQRQFKYILGTFKDLDAKKKYVWENKIFDEVTRADDYRSLVDVEDFIREALPKVVIRMEGDTTRLRMYSPDQNKLFLNEPFMMIDNHFLPNSRALFRLPLDAIEEIRQIYHLDRLRNFGTPFVNGVLIVTTKDGDYTNDYDKQGGRYATFHAFQSDPEIDFAANFKRTLLFDISQSDTTSVKIEASKELGEFKANVETLTKEGNYLKSSHDVRVVNK